MNRKWTLVSHLFKERERMAMLPMKRNVGPCVCEEWFSLMDCRGGFRKSSEDIGFAELGKWIITFTLSLDVSAIGPTGKEDWHRKEEILVFFLLDCVLELIGCSREDRFASL